MVLLKHKALRPFCWVALAILVLAADYFTGPFIQFPIFFVIPVTLISWHDGRKWGFLFAIGLPLFRIYFATCWDVSYTMLETILNAMIRICILCAIAFFVDRTAELLKELKILRGILPICSFCKRIRDDGNKWEPLEDYITEHSEAEFSHGLCPECMKKQYGVSIPPEE